MRLPDGNPPAGSFREICCCCNRPSPVGFWVPDEIWNASVPLRFKAILCIACFARFADEAGIEWDREIKFYPVSLRTHLQESVRVRTADFLHSDRILDKT